MIAMPKMLRRTEEQLQQRRAELAHVLNEQVASQNEWPAADGDWVDQAVKGEDLSLIDQLVAAERAQIARIDAALDRIRHGSYGCCTSCGGEIEDFRLRTMPETPLCLSCAVAKA